MNDRIPTPTDRTFGEVMGVRIDPVPIKRKPTAVYMIEPSFIDRSEGTTITDVQIIGKPVITYG